MNLIELKDKLCRYNVPGRWYALDEGLKPDACILLRNYRIWEYFYLTERGERLDHRVFDNAEDAYAFLWDKMKHQLEIFKIKPRQ